MPFDADPHARCCCSRHAPATLPLRDAKVAALAAQFPASVATHRMHVLHTHGLYRTLRFAQPASSVQHFTLTTWPGCLAITGDMGAFVFSRVTDMFTFFRQPLDQLPDFHYWAQKVVAEDRPAGTRRYDPDLFRSAVAADLEAFVEAHTDDFTESAVRSLRVRVETDVLALADDGEERAVAAAMGFTLGKHDPFPEFYDHELRTFTPQFIWCGLAIRWGIAQWDAYERASERIGG